MRTRLSNLCLDSGYVGETAKREIEERGYIPHVRPRGEEIEEKDKNPDFKARRWVVEVCHSWFNRFRKLLVRYKNGSELSRLAHAGRFYHRLSKNQAAK